MASKLYVGGLAYSTTSESLRALFAQRGTVESAAVVSDRDSGQSRGFGFVEMSTQPEAEEAIAKLDGQSFEGRPAQGQRRKPEGLPEGALALHAAPARDRATASAAANATVTLVRDRQPARRQAQGREPLRRSVTAPRSGRAARRRPGGFAPGRVQVVELARAARPQEHASAAAAKQRHGQKHEHHRHGASAALGAERCAPGTS